MSRSQAGGHRRQRGLTPTAWWLAVLVAGLCITAATAAIQLRTATQLVSGEGFCPGIDACRVRALGAGFPLPFLVDNPQVSVPNAIHLVEDDFRWPALFFDLILWTSVVWWAFRRFKR